MGVASGSTLSVKLTLSEAETFKAALNAIATDGSTSLQVLQAVVQKLATDFVGLTDKQNLAAKSSAANKDAVDKSTVSYTQLKAGLDPVYAALLKHEQAVTTTKQAVALGSTTQADATNTLRLAGEQYANTMLSLNLMAGAWGQAQKAARDNAAATEALTVAYQATRASVDPLYAAEMKLKSAQEVCNAAVTEGVAKQEEANVVMDAAKGVYQGVADKLVYMADAWNMSLKALADSERLVAGFNAARNSVDQTAAAMSTYEARCAAVQAAVGHLGHTQEDADRVINLLTVDLNAQLEKLSFVGAAMDAAAKKTAATASANQELAAAYDRLRAAGDPLFEAQQKLAAGEATVNATVAAGLRTKEEAVPILANLRMEYGLVERSLIAMGNAEELNAANIKANTDALAASSAAFHAQWASVDPVVAAVVAYDRAVQRAMTSVADGTATQAEANAMLEKAHSRYLEVYNSQSDAAKAAKKLADENAAAAKEAAGIVAGYDQTKSAIDRVYAAEQTRLKQTADIAKARASGRIDDAQQRIDLDQVAAAYKRATDEQVKHGHDGAGATVASSNAIREFIVISHEAVSGNLTRIPGSLMVLAEMNQNIFTTLGGVVGRIGNIITSFLSMGYGAVAAGVAIVGASAAAIISHEAHEAALNTLGQHLRATHTEYMSLADGVSIAAKQAATSIASLSMGDAKTALATIAATPEFNAAKANMVSLARTATDLAKVLNITVPEAAKHVALAFHDPGAEAKKLADEGLTTLGQGLAGTIERMQAAGDKSGATAKLLGLMNAAIGGASDPATEAGKAYEKMTVALKNLEIAIGPVLQSIGGAMVKIITDASDFLTKFVDKLKESRAEIDKQRDPVTGSMFKLTYEPSTGGAAGTTPGAQSSVTAYQSALPGEIAEILQRSIASASAKFGVNPALTAYLQSTEGKFVNGAWDIGRNADGSTTSAQGPMQVLSGTAEDMRKKYGVSGSQSSTAISVDTGTAYLSDMLTEFGGNPVLAIIGYKIGPHLLHQILDSKAGGPPVNLTTAQMANYADAASKASRYSGGPGRLEAATVGAQPAPGAVKAPAGDVYNYPPVPTGTAVSGLPPEVNQAQAIYKSLGSFEETHAKLAANVALFQKARAELDQITPTGEVLWKTLGEAGAKANAEISDGLAKASGDLYKSRDPVETLIHGMEETAKTAYVASGATRELAKTDEQLNEAARGAGAAGATQEQLDRGRIARMKELDSGFRDQIDSLARTTAGQEKVTASLVAGGGATEHLTNQMKAEEDVRKTNDTRSAEYKIKVDALTASLDKQAKVMANQAVEHSTLNAKLDTTLIEAETSTLGMNADKRELILAALKTEISLKKTLQVIDPATAQAAVDASVREVEAQQKLTRYTQAASDVSSELSSAFTTVGNSITDAFTKGAASTVTFKSVMQGLETQIAQFILKITILNPLLNELFSQKLTTIGTVGGLVGNMLGNTPQSEAVAGATASASSSSGSMSNDLGILSTLWKGANWLTDDALNNLASSAWTSVGGKDFANSFISVFSGVGKGMGAFGSLASSNASAVGALGAAQVPQVLGVIGGGTEIGSSIGTGIGMGDAAGTIVDGATSIADSAGSIASSIGSLVGEYIPYIGAAIGAIIAISKGDYRGASEIVGFTAAGALIGTYVFPLIGTAVGAAIGAVVGTIASMFGPGPEHPYSATAINVENGRLVEGNTVSAKTDTTQAQSAVQAYADVINKMNDILGLTLTNAGQIASLGANIKDYAQTTDLNTVFKDLRFTSKSQDSNLGVAEAALLPGKSFADAPALGAFLIKIAQLTDGLDALGISLGGVQDGADGFKNIWIKSVAGTSDFSKAMQQDLGRQSYADQAALEAEISKVYTFVETTMPAMTNATGHAISSFLQGIVDINKSYADAEAQARSYGLSIDGLVAANAKLIAQQQVIAQQAIQKNSSDYAARDATALGDPTGAALITFDASAQAQQDALRDLFLTYYGEAGLVSGAYVVQQQQLDKTLADERLVVLAAITAKYTEFVASSQTANDNYNTRILTAEGKTGASAVYAADVKGAAEIASIATRYKAMFGDVYTTMAEYKAEVSRLTSVLSLERQALIAKNAADDLAAAKTALTTAQSSEATARDAYANAIQAHMTVLQTNTTALVAVAANLHNFIATLATSESSPLTPGDQLYASKAKFATDIVDARGGNQTAAGALSGDASTMLDKAASYYGKASAQYADLFKQTNDQLAGAEAYYITQAMISQRTLDVETAIETLVRDGLVSISALNDAIKQTEHGNTTGLDALSKQIGSTSALDVSALNAIKQVASEGNAGNIISLEALAGVYKDTGLGDITAINNMITAVTAAGNGTDAVIELVKQTILAGNATASATGKTQDEINKTLDQMVKDAAVASSSTDKSLGQLIHDVVSGNGDAATALDHVTTRVGDTVIAAEANGKSLTDISKSMAEAAKAAATAAATSGKSLTDISKTLTDSQAADAAARAAELARNQPVSAIQTMHNALVLATAAGAGAVVGSVTSLRDAFTEAQSAVVKAQATADAALAISKVLEAALAAASKDAPAVTPPNTPAPVPPAPPAESATSRATAQVTSDYQALLGRAPDAAGLSYWVNLLLGGMTDQQVHSNIAQLPEAQIRGDYLTLLNRAPDAAGFAYWLGQMQAGASNASVVAGIKSLPEYKALHGLAEGGWVGNGMWGKDSVVASYAGGGGIALAGGEFVVSAASAARYGDVLPSINRGSYSNDNSETAALRKEIGALRAQMAQLIKISAAGHVAVRDAVNHGNKLTASGLATNKLRAAR